MSTDRQPTESPFDLHCGRCVHLSQRGDEDRVYCTYHDREPIIRFGDVCSEYREQAEPSEESPADDAESDSRRIRIDESETLPGRTGPFYAVYGEGGKEGWYCSTCQGIEVTADPMGRMKCSRCGNLHSSDRWDAAYL
jgi:hypothetical protein